MKILSLILCLSLLFKCINNSYNSKLYLKRNDYLTKAFIKKYFNKNINKIFYIQDTKNVHARVIVKIEQSRHYVAIDLQVLENRNLGSIEMLYFGTSAPIQIKKFKDGNLFKNFQILSEEELVNPVTLTEINEFTRSLTDKYSNYDYYLNNCYHFTDELYNYILTKANMKEKTVDHYQDAFIKLLLEEDKNKHTNHRSDSELLVDAIDNREGSVGNSSLTMIPNKKQYKIRKLPF